MQIEYNRNKKKKTWRRQPVGYLQAWLRIWTRDDQEQIQQVAKVGLEPQDCRIGSVMWGPLGHAASPVRVLGELGGGKGGESKREGGLFTVLMKKGVNLWQHYSWQADYPQLPSDLTGQTFNHVFGTNTSR